MEEKVMYWAPEYCPKEHKKKLLQQVGNSGKK
jgi:hypothetical protein